MILSLDISTTITGVSFFKDEKLTDYFAIRLSKIKHEDKFEELILKANEVINQIKKNINLNKVNLIVIEEPIMNSMNRNTVNTLLKFNTMISTMLRMDNKEIIFQNVNHVRSWLFKNNESNAESDKKQRTIEIVNKLYKLDLIKSQNDIADAIMHAHYYLKNN